VRSEKDGHALQDGAIEARVLGCTIEYPHTIALVEQYGGAELFWRDSTRHWWRAITANASASTSELDGHAVISWMSTRDLLEPSGGAEQWRWMKLNAVRPHVLESSLVQLRDLAQRRRLVQLAHELHGHASEGAPMHESLASIRAATTSLDVVNTRSAGVVAKEVRERMVAVMQGTTTAAHATNIQWLDYMLGGGLQDGHSYYTGGLYKTGKTKMAGVIAHAMMCQGWHIDWYSTEMGDHEMMTRFLSLDANVPQGHITRSKKMSSTDFSSIIDSAHKAKDWHWRHQKRGEWKAENIANQAAARVHANPDAKHLIVVDYIQAIGTVEKLWGHEKVKRASAVINGISKDLDVPVIVVFQMAPGKVEGRTQGSFIPVPKPGDAGGSSQIMQDANHMLIVHRPWLQQRGRQSRFTTLDLAISRDQDVKRCYLYADLARNSFRPWEDDIPNGFEPLEAEEQPWLM